MATNVRKILKNQLLAHGPKIQQWFADRHQEETGRFLPFYSSFDLRDADYKIAPVDANLFPAGFNNICPHDRDTSPPLIRKAWETLINRVPQRLALIGEAHTRNLFYAQNLKELASILRKAGIDVRLAWLPTASPSEVQTSKSGVFTLPTADGDHITVHLAFRDGHKLILESEDSKDDSTLDPWVPDTILLNNDLSAGIPVLLDGLEQPLIPSPKLGWHSRRKHSFFHHYNHLVEDFCQLIQTDPWPMKIQTSRVKDVNFLDDSGLDRVADASARILDSLRQDYEKRGIRQEPFVFIKNNAGTYGMGIMKISRPEEILHLNRRERNKMHMGKGNTVINDVIVQEGIKTRFTLEGVYAEPVIYMVGHELMGGFLRTNPQKSDDENLNSKGMSFERLCIADLREEADRDLELELVYGVLAQISCAAVSRELRDLDSPSLTV